MRNWTVTVDSFDDRVGTLSGPGFSTPCALGKHGVVISDEKREGDGKSPLGVWPVRNIFYRPDKEEKPVSHLPVKPLTPHMGWCDDPEDSQYNKLVPYPWRSSAETLWREDEIYDLILVLGYNDHPPIPAQGSAIFLHVAREGLQPTQGCIALPIDAVKQLLAFLMPGDNIVITRSITGER